MNKYYQLTGVALFASSLCMGQAKYWANNMQLLPVDSSKVHRIQLSVGAGIISQSRSTRAALNAVTTATGGVSVYLSLGEKSVYKPIQSEIGMYIGFSYGQGIGGINTSTQRNIGIAGQRQLPQLLTSRLGKPRNLLLSFEVGTQYNIGIGKLLISPIVTAGFVQLNQEALRIAQRTTLALPGSGLDTTIQFTLYAQEGLSKTGIAFIPKLRTGYTVGRVGFWTEVQYISGPAVRRNIAQFVPEGLPNTVTGLYTLNQVKQGYPVADGEGVTIKYRAWGIRAGINLTLSKTDKRFRKKCTCGQ